ncbi:MAG: ParA family protein [Methyloprofundus sp.]|nr:ParA family protein [Methyloprofundus sp.]
MITFDQILPKLKEVFSSFESLVSDLGEILINRDLNGRVSLILSDAHDSKNLVDFKTAVSQAIAPHAAKEVLLFEEDMAFIKMIANCIPLEGFKQIFVIDRLVTEGSWLTISEESTRAKRIVFFSIKGGVGRSTALAVTAWSLAEQGKKVLVLDLDLESPGLSSNLLPEDRRPSYGITDWLVEDLVDNGDLIFKDMVALSSLSRNGEIYVVPAHGRDSGEYVSKLGRVWMPKFNQGQRESWSTRLERLITALEEAYDFDVILIDSRAGIDEVASACVTDLKANLVLMFAISGEQTWSGYGVLFRYWLQSGVISQIRERLRIVGAMVPTERKKDYMDDLIEEAQMLFTRFVYDEISPGEFDGFNFDEEDQSAPHYPWVIEWHTGFNALASIHNKLDAIDPKAVELVFGDLITNLLGEVDAV